jgi:hypothetical protein
MAACVGAGATEIASGRLTLKMAEKQNGRAWTQPLYEKRPKQPKPPKPAKPRKPDQPNEPAPSAGAQLQ